MQGPQIQSPKFHVLYGTQQSGKVAIIPDIVAACFPNAIKIPTNGIGTLPQDRVRRRQSGGWLRRKIDVLVAFSMADRICEAWEKTREVQNNNDQIIFMGCSRGGFSAQILAQMIHQFGYAQSDNTDIIKKFKSGKNSPLSTNPLQQIHALYALDPVGTRRFLKTPSTFLGFNCKILAGVANCARVVLMFGERCIGFRPNIYNDSPILRQMWFNGFHGDAWGPSILSLHVLAYILSDLEQAINQNICYKQLCKCVFDWGDLPDQRPPPHSVTSSDVRCTPPVTGSQHLHVSLTAALGPSWQQQYMKTQRETNLLALLMAITYPRMTDIMLHGVFEAVSQFAIPQLIQLQNDADIGHQVQAKLVTLQGLDNSFV